MVLAFIARLYGCHFESSNNRARRRPEQPDFGRLAKVALFQDHDRDYSEFEVLEKPDDDLSPMEVADRLKEKRRHWIALLNALPLY